MVHLKISLFEPCMNLFSPTYVYFVISTQYHLLHFKNLFLSNLGWQLNEKQKSHNTDWLTVWILEPGFLGWSCSSTTSWFRDLEQNTSSVYACVSSNENGLIIVPISWSSWTLNELIYVDSQWIHRKYFKNWCYYGIMISDFFGVYLWTF